MSSPGKLPRGRLSQFLDYYAKGPSRAERAVEREVFGTNAGITSYTTVAQAGELARELRLGPDTVLLEIGSGAGWPGRYLAEETGCRAVLTDVPAAGLRSPARAALRARLSFARASGTDLPFRARSFDAVVHSDVL